ncbi:MAG: hypothetical protein JWQ48_346, partial [Conexibacter sp.]|nr:hypothetical protein [Conexibacter sp.]
REQLGRLAHATGVEPLRLPRVVAPALDRGALAGLADALEPVL